MCLLGFLLEVARVYLCVCVFECVCVCLISCLFICGSGWVQVCLFGSK